MEFQGLTRNAKESQVIEKEREGTHTNPCCSLKAPPTSHVVEILTLDFLTHRWQQCQLRAQDSRHGWQADKLYI